MMAFLATLYYSCRMAAWALHACGEWGWTVGVLSVLWLAASLLNACRTMSPPQNRPPLKVSIVLRKLHALTALDCTPWDPGGQALRYQMVHVQSVCGKAGTVPATGGPSHMGGGEISSSRAAAADGERCSSGGPGQRPCTLRQPARQQSSAALQLKQSGSNSHILSRLESPSPKP
jgi:hypothetical protein